MREEFEAWAAKMGLPADRYDTQDELVPDEYKTLEAHFAWLAWQASRAALCVELPEVCKGHAITVDEFHQQLDKAGVSYK